MFTIHINNRFKLVVANDAAPIGARDFGFAPVMLNQSGFSERASAVD